MSTRLVRAWSAIALGAGLLVAMHAAEGREGGVGGGNINRGRSERGESSKSSNYSVAMIRDAYGAVTFEALPSRDVKKREEELLKDYTEACKNYKEAKKDNPKEPKPAKPALRIVKSGIRGKDAKSDADAAAAKFQEKYDEKKGKKGDKEEKKEEKKEAKKEAKREGDGE